MWKLFLKVGLFTLIISMGAVVAVVAMRCDRGQILLVNALKVDQPGLSLFASSRKQSLLWKGSIQSGGVEVLFLQNFLGSNMLLEGTNAASGQKFSQSSYYVSSIVPYGTHMYLIEPYGIRSIFYREFTPPRAGSEPLRSEMLRVGFWEIISATRCVDADLWRWWTR
jgi:hypothetical protein